MAPKILKTAAKYGGLWSIVAAQTPIHESMHGITAELTGGDCSGIFLNQDTQWYMKPFEWLTGGFVKLQQLDPGVDGFAKISHPDTTFGKVGGILTSAMPEYVYTTMGMAFVSSGLKDWNTKPFTGMLKTLVGGVCMKNTLYYMGVSFWGAKPGHDYYNVTQKALEMAHLPGDWATVATPAIGIPALFAASYFSAAILTSIFGKKE
ncbi:hypothetical protein HY837_06665 [archaeon]|nr:hypothetical protein [archaeon]